MKELSTYQEIKLDLLIERIMAKDKVFVEQYNNRKAINDSISDTNRKVNALGKIGFMISKEYSKKHSQIRKRK